MVKDQHNSLWLHLYSFQPPYLNPFPPLRLAFFLLSQPPLESYSTTPLYYNSPTFFTIIIHSFSIFLFFFKKEKTTNISCFPPELLSISAAKLCSRYKPLTEHKPKLDIKGLCFGNLSLEKAKGKSFCNHSLNHILLQMGQEKIREDCSESSQWFPVYLSAHYTLWNWTQKGLGDYWSRAKMRTSTSTIYGEG